MTRVTRIRLQKYLANNGINSRRKCEELIISGKVKVNNEVITKLGTTIDPEKDVIQLNNKIIRNENKHIYILLNKPIGYLCTYHDSFGRQTIFDLTKEIKIKLNYAGRLDYLSEGLVLLTNDGDLIYKITHPKKKIEKVYIVKINGIPERKDIEKLEKGVSLSPKIITRPCLLKMIKKNNNSSFFRITLLEGKKRQIRRMFSMIGFLVLKLKRIKVGILSLDKLKTGEYRYLRNDEIKKLKSII